MHIEDTLVAIFFVPVGDKINIQSFFKTLATRLLLVKMLSASLVHVVVFLHTLSGLMF